MDPRDLRGRPHRRHRHRRRSLLHGESVEEWFRNDHFYEALEKSFIPQVTGEQKEIQISKTWREFVYILNRQGELRALRHDSHDSSK